MIEIKDTNISFIEEVLEGFYYIDKVHTVSFKETSENIFEAGFDFKPYSKVIHPLGHVQLILYMKLLWKFFIL
jgi:hypothetical protein